MAMYVLLSFDDDKDARAFIEKVSQESDTHGETWMLWPAKVRGLFKKPTLFCKCFATKKGRAFTRGKKYGWWVCTSCGKPTPAWARGEHWFLALGRNLLPIGEEAPEYRGDGVFQTHVAKKTCDKCDTELRGQVGHSTVKVWCPKCEEAK